MALAPGTRLGPYEIIVQIGQGGMGEVYRATDTKLKRQVAIKILPLSLAADPDRLARFQREAEVLASLNHPHIAAIYGIEESHDVRALVMELVEGDDLSQRLARGAIPMDEALPIARQIAEALEAAHDQGIIHRDLKPANIKVRVDGTVKVLDFGLAKLASPQEGLGDIPSSLPLSPTITSPAMMTGAGVILGTAAYMAPEQAKGRHADKRSDVWAFGVVLYEMLSGQRAFKGDDVADTIASVLRQDVDWSALPASTPASIRALIERCLDRDVRQRLRDIGEARIVLADPARTATAGMAQVVALTPPPLWRRAVPVVVAAVLAGALVGVSAWRLKPSPPLRLTRLALTLPPGQAFSPAASLRHLVALSDDGRQIVYAANTRLYLRSMSELQAQPIQGTDGYQLVTDPVFSPDGRSVAFFALSDHAIKRIALAGGPAVTICAAENPYGIQWSRDGIVFGQGRKGIMRVSADGGTVDTVARVNTGEEAHGPQMLPGGTHVLFTLATGNSRDRWDKARIVVQSVASDERKTIIEGGSDARYVPTGHLVYAVSGIVYAVPFDVQRMQVMGAAMPMVEGVRRASGATTGTAHFSVSRNGSLIYVAGPVTASSALLDIALIDRNGTVERLNLPPGPYWSPRVSPDGQRLVVGFDDGSAATIYVYELSGTTSRRRLTFVGNNRFPIWSSDGSHITFQSDRDGDLAIFTQAADGGTGIAERLTTPAQGESHAPEAWSPKADRLLFSITRGSDVSLWTLSLQDRKAVPFGDVHSLNPTGGVFSPDGRWVAYTSTERDATTVYVQPFPEGGRKYQLFAKEESDSPHEVVWSPDGKELFYNPRAGDLEAVSVTTQPTFAFGNPVAVPRPFQLSPVASRRAYDVTPTGRFVGLIPAGQTDASMPIAPQIEVVLNWFEELHAKAAAK